jgi:membrane-bound serine protease (ClpP class)
VSFVIGSLLLINAPEAPFLQISVYAIIAVTTVLVLFFLVIVTAVIRSRHRPVVTGREGLLGAPGIVRRDLEPERPGLVLTQGELWQAVSNEGRIGEEEKVVVQSIDGLLLTVRRASDIAPAPRRPAQPAVAKSEIARA